MFGYHIDDRLIVDKHGMLDRALLHHPEVLEAASEFGDPYRVCSLKDPLFKFLSIVSVFIICFFVCIHGSRTECRR